MTLVLRKSFGKYSAGTAVELVTQPGKTRSEVVVRATYTAVEWFTDFAYRRQQRRTVITEEFEIPTDLLTELRSRTDEVPEKNRRVRRAENKLAYEVLNKIKAEH